MRFLRRVSGLLVILAGISIAWSGHFSDSKFKADIYGWQARIYGILLAIFGYLFLRAPDGDRK